MSISIFNRIRAQRLWAAAAATLVVFCGGAVASAEWVQWTAASGGNGHWYQVVLAPNVVGPGMGISWTDANAAAQADGSYLATVTSAAENDFIFDLIDIATHPSYWQDLGWGYFGPWIGAQQNPLPPTYGPSYANTNWSWVTGEPWSYTNWGNATGSRKQPNDGHATTDGGDDGFEEDKVLYIKYDTIAETFWCDVANVDPAPPIASGKAPIAYIMERTIPEPSTFALLAAGLGSLAAFAWRRRRAGA